MMGFTVYSNMQYKALGDDVGLYPFVVVKDGSGRTYQESQDMLLGDNSAEIHVWCLEEDKLTFENMMQNIAMMIHNISQLPSYNIMVNMVNRSTVVDDTTGVALYHGILTPEFLTF